MPTETFLRLSVDKKNTLLRAAKKEFQEHLLEDASINQIIKKAGISRGSFYTYFKNKEDIYSYLLKQFREDIYTSLLKNLKTSKGDFIKACENLFTDMLSYCTTEENMDFFRNVFLNLRYTSDKKISFKPTDIQKKQYIEEILEYIDFSLYTLKSEDIFDAFELTMIISNTSMTHIFMNPKNIKKEIENYKRRLHMLKYGICKEEEN